MPPPMTMRSGSISATRLGQRPGGGSGRLVEDPGPPARPGHREQKARAPRTGRPNALAAAASSARPPATDLERARPAAAAGRAVPLDGHEAEMAGQPLPALEQPATLDDPAADAGRDGHEDEAAGTAPGTVTVLAPGGRGPVVQQGDGPAQALLEHARAKGTGAVTRNVARFDGVERAALHEAGGRDGHCAWPDPRSGRAAASAAATTSALDVRFRRRGELAAFGHLAVGDERGGDLAAADVEGQDRHAPPGPCRASMNQRVTCSGRVMAEPTTTARAPASRAARA